MQISNEVFEKVKQAEAKVLVVTKYHSPEDTKILIDSLESYSDGIEWFWENRISDIKQKDIPRELCHFIGNIQTKEIKLITEYCSVIHSVDNIKHIKKIEEICEKQNNWVEVYLQINLDPKKPGGITLDWVAQLVDYIGELDNVSLVWFSWIGAAETDIATKKAEFKTLLDLRAKYTQNGFVSAGTSRDYEIALEMWVDIVRIGKAIIV